MSRFLEHLHDLVGAFTEYVLEPLKATSRGLVEDDEYVLVFIVFLGIPALVVTLLIARCIRRAHNRVRYASEYRDTEGTDYVSTSSSSVSSGADEVETDLPSTAGLRRRRGRRNEVSMDEVVHAARQLTEQETERRRRNRREAARGERGRAGGGAAGEPAPDGETEGKED